MKTLPEWCMEWGLAVDAARELLRKRPDLASSAIQVGANRAFNADAAERIHSALLVRKAKRPPQPATC